MKNIIKCVDLEDQTEARNLNLMKSANLLDQANLQKASIGQLQKKAILKKQWKNIEKELNRQIENQDSPRDESELKQFLMNSRSKKSIKRGKFARRSKLSIWNQLYIEEGQI